MPNCSHTWFNNNQLVIVISFLLSNMPINEKAQIAKDKVLLSFVLHLQQTWSSSRQGNAAFKAGDYPAAIGHYTAAILADRNDSTYPLNRAAAYLKLGKCVPSSTQKIKHLVLTLLSFRNEDAERDCSTVLDLGKNNVKGLFRRGQARVALGKLLDARKGRLALRFASVSYWRGHIC